MLRLSGWLYESGTFPRGSVVVEDGAIIEVSHGSIREADAKGLILPAFANAHTHAGDALVAGDHTGTLEELVAPPHGLKHRVLAAAKDEDVVAATHAFLEQMLRSGTTTFWDFREMGLRGVRQLYSAALGLPLHPIVFGRPADLTYDAKEIQSLLRACDGVGLSSLLDWDRDDAAKIAKDAQRADVPLALHASERIREDIDAILDLKPRLLVHMTEGTDADLETVRDADVPIVVCPRSNAFFGKIVDLPRMARAGVRLLLGTDNAMISSPSMLRELEFAWRIARLRGGIEPRLLLDAALRGGKGLSAPDDATLVPGDPADLVVLDVRGGRPTFRGLFRCGETDIACISAGGRTWLRKGEGLAEHAPPQGPRPKGGGPRRRPRTRR